MITQAVERRDTLATSVQSEYDGRMRLHITIKDETMTEIRRMAKAAKCEADTDRETLQNYLHHITNQEPPRHGGLRPGGFGREPATKKKKKKE